jgi:hypothetical protein
MKIFEINDSNFNDLEDDNYINFPGVCYVFSFIDHQWVKLINLSLTLSNKKCL